MDHRTTSNVAPRRARGGASTKLLTGTDMTGSDLVGTVGDWLEQQADRISVRQRSQVETAKLLVTFATGIAATLVGTALQVDGRPWQEVVGVVLLAISTVGAVMVVLLDSMREADYSNVLRDAEIRELTPAERLKELRSIQIAAVDVNEKIVRRVRATSLLQVLVAAASGVFAVLGI